MIRDGPAMTEAANRGAWTDANGNLLDRIAATGSRDMIDDEWLCVMV